MVVEYTTFGGGGVVGLILSGCTSIWVVHVPHPQVTSVKRGVSAVTQGLTLLNVLPLPVFQEHHRMG